jgi:hypothetical protein
MSNGLPRCIVFAPLRREWLLAYCAAVLSATEDFMDGVRPWYGIARFEHERGDGGEFPLIGRC